MVKIKLCKQFKITVLITSLVFVLLAFVMFGVYKEHTLVSFAERASVEYTSNIQSLIQRKLAKEPSIYTGIKNPAHVPFFTIKGKKLLAYIDSTVKSSINMNGIKKVSILDRQGNITYSTAKHEIGRKESHELFEVPAKTAGIKSVLKTVEPKGLRGKSTEIFIKTYIPVYSAPGEIIGVFETYYNPYKLLGLVYNSYAIIVLFIFSSILLGFFTMFPLLKKGDTALELVLKSVDDSLEKILHKHNNLLEEIVSDDLTGVYSRAFFNKRIQEEFDRAVRFNRSLSLIMIDIDSFKDINDAYGSEYGDTCLRELAMLITKNVRRTDPVVRYAGDSFCVISIESNSDDSYKTAINLQKVISSSVFGDKKIRLTVSIGISSLMTDKGFFETSDELVEHAERCLRFAGEQGRNTVERSFGNVVIL